MKYISHTNLLRNFPEFHRLHENPQWNIEKVGHSYDYDESVSDQRLYAFHGVFMELFIRKYLCQKLGIPCEDNRTERILLQPNTFDSEYVYDDLCRAYAAYQNPKIPALKIIEDIKIVALSQRITHCEDLEPFEDVICMQININNLKEVMRFLDEMPYKHMEYKETCDLFLNDDFILRGVPDYIFDGKIFCQIATSKYFEMPMDKLAQVVLYIMGHYGRYYYGAVKEFTILMYNPLLGYKYTTHLKLTQMKFDRMLDSINMKVPKFYGKNWL